MISKGHVILENHVHVIFKGHVILEGHVTILSKLELCYTSKTIRVLYIGLVYTTERNPQKKKKKECMHELY